MASEALSPTLTESIDQRYLIEALDGGSEPRYYMDRFPEEVYNKSIDSHLTRFMYSMLGPSGVGYLRRNFLETRLIYEAQGLELYDLDRFYGDPFQFGRIPEETYTEDILGLLPQEDWERIRSKDARYRNRIIDFLAGARAGTTPFGMRLVARSGLGHEVEIVENYRALFDQNSDDRLDLPYLGQTRFLNEMVILPRQEVSRSEVQELTMVGSPTGGTFTLNPPGSRSTTPLDHDATRQEVELALAEAYQVPRGNIEVEGGPLPDAPFIIRFVGDLGGQNLNQLEVVSQLTGGQNAQIIVTTSQQGLDGSSEVAYIAPRDQYQLQQAIDRTRAVSVIPTTAPASGTKSRINWVAAGASSEFDEMVRYVTGNGRVTWPERDRVHWIESGVEHQALRAQGNLAYHYGAFHEMSVRSYVPEALNSADYQTANWPSVADRFASDHFGSYNRFHAALFSFLKDPTLPERSIIDRILPDQTEPLHVARVVEVPGGSVGLINGIYPTDYQALPGVPAMKYGKVDQFWSSREVPTGNAEYIEVDLGQPRAVNYISFELSRKPVEMQIEYDASGLDDFTRQWHPVTYSPSFPAAIPSVFSATETNPWRTFEYYFGNAKNEMIFTRFLRMKLTRVAQAGFLAGIPWSVDIRNLRVGRVVSNQ